MSETPKSSFFQEVVDIYYQPLYRFAYSLAKSEHGASDLTQQTFVTFAEKGGELRDTSKVKSWLFTTLYREFLRQRKRGARMDYYEPEVLEATGGAVPAEARKSYDAQLAVDALEAVDETYRPALVLFYMKDQSYKEIAETLDIPIGTVMSRLNRGKTQLRAAFQNGANTEPETE